MSDTTYIKFIEVCGSRYFAVPGERLFMSDGSIWFHPYDGTKPWREPS